VRPKEKCTVSALRAEAADVDVSLRPRRPEKQRQKTLAADLSAMAERR
jgi:hypothetical protein